MAIHSASGVVLGRRMVGEGDLLLSLFLKGVGKTSASARGAAMGRVRFGGGTEPLVWGVFSLHQAKGGGLHLRGVDVADDMLCLRTRPEALFTAIRWAKLLSRHLMAGKPEEPHPSDALLANLYWSMKLLGRVPPEVADWRFLWRWLKGWGLAPQLSECLDREPWELDLLRGAAATRQEDLIARPWEPHRRLFASAARRVELFLREV